MRVTGSMTTRDISVPLRRGFFRLFRFRRRGCAFALVPVLARQVSDGMSRRGRGNAADDGPADFARGNIHPEAGRVGQPLVKGRFRIPEVRGGAADAAMTGLDR